MCVSHTHIHLYNVYLPIRAPDTAQVKLRMNYAASNSAMERIVDGKGWFFCFVKYSFHPINWTFLDIYKIQS